MNKRYLVTGMRNELPVLRTVETDDIFDVLELLDLPSRGAFMTGKNKQSIRYQNPSHDIDLSITLTKRSV